MEGETSGLPKGIQNCGVLRNANIYHKIFQAYFDLIKPWLSSFVQLYYREICRRTEVKNCRDEGGKWTKNRKKHYDAFYGWSLSWMKLNILAETLQVYLFSIFATYLTQVNKDLGTGNGSVVTHMVRIQRLGCRIWISQMVNGESNGECIQAFVSHGPSTFLHQ